MARVSWRGDLRKLQNRIENLPEDMLDMAEEIITDESETGAAEMRMRIKQADTPTSIREGRQGRVKTGTMLNEVGVTPTKRNRRSVVGSFGWGSHGDESAKYREYQENGFKHYRTGKDVAPMHARLEAYMHARERFFARMRSEMRRRRG